MDNLTDMFRGKAMGLEPKVDTSGIQEFEQQIVYEKPRSGNELTGMNMMGGFDFNSLISTGNNKKMDFFKTKKGKSFDKTVKEMVGTKSSKKFNFFGNTKNKNMFTNVKHKSMNVDNFLSFGKSKKQKLIDVNGILGIEKNARQRIVKRPDMIGFSRIKKQQGLSMFGDYDKDKVFNVLDCQPFNKNKQGAMDTIRRWTGVEKSNDSYNNMQGIMPQNIEVYNNPEEYTQPVEEYDVEQQEESMPTEEIATQQFNVDYQPTGLEIPQQREMTDEEIINQKTGIMAGIGNLYKVLGGKTLTQIRKEKEEIQNIYLEAQREAAKKAGQLNTAAEYKKAYKKELEELYPEVKKLHEQAEKSVGVRWVKTPDGSYIPISTKTRTTKRTGYRAIPDVITSGTREAARSISPGYSGQQYLNLLSVGSGGGLFEAVGSISRKPYTQKVSELVGAKRAVMESPQPMQQPVRQYPQDIPEEPQYYRPPETPRETDPGLVYSPLSKRYVRYPRGPYKKRIGYQ